MRRLRGLLGLWLVVAWAGLACGGTTPPPLPFYGADRAISFPPPPQYASWWVEMAECTGLKAPIEFEDIEFRLVISHTLQGRVVGMVNGPNGDQGPFDVVYLPTDRVLDKAVVTHEFIHVYIGHGGHPSPPFKRCAEHPIGAAPRTWNPS